VYQSMAGPLIDSTTGDGSCRGFNAGGHDRSLPETLPGIGACASEAAATRARLSRGVAGVRGGALVVNLPGSPRGAVESLDAVAELLPHAIEVLRGARHD
jgi:molybdopterin biosynthesis enzyme MoaB